MRKLYIGQNIKYLRHKKKLTQEALGEQIGVKKAAVSTYEIGRNFPTVEGLVKMADLFEVDMEAFFFKNISSGEPGNRVEEPETIYRDELSKLMLSRIRELEREIKENVPDLARRLDL